VRAGRKPGISQGALNAELQEVADNVSALWVGELSEAAQKHLVQEQGLPVAPHRILLHATVDESKGIDLHFRGMLRTPQEAQVVTEAILRSRARQRVFLEKLRPNRSAEVMIEVLESVRVEARGASVSGEARVSGDFPEALGEVLELTVGRAVVEALTKPLGAAIEGMVRIVLYGLLGGMLLVLVVIVFALMSLRGFRRRRVSE
jgi:hypothetical protein